MTATVDPSDPAYLDPADLRRELTRVFEHCHGCRLCLHLCPAFPRLFDAIDARDGDVPGLSVEEQDQVVAACYQCKLCYLKCPYVPPHEWQIDFPRLMLRAEVQRRAERRSSIAEWVADQTFGRTDLVGTVASALAPVANGVLGRPGSVARRAMEATVGVASERVLPPYSRVRFGRWWRRHPRRPIPEPRGRVSLFATCFVEYMRPEIGHDTVRVLEHNDIDCLVPDGIGCCGAPWLHQGDMDRFRAVARRNVAVLEREVEAGRQVVVPQPTCAYVIRRDYPVYLGTEAAARVAAATKDPCEYLGDLRRADRAAFDTRVAGALPEQVVLHAACHTQAQAVGLRSRDLLRAMGAKVTVVSKCAGIDGTWGLKRENYQAAKEVARPLAEAIATAGPACLAGDCHLANGAIAEETGTWPRHPMEIIARAYGIPEAPWSAAGRSGSPLTGSRS
jgi:glycerol-3-phosphate dehydrogenase subunit C